MKGKLKVAGIVLVVFFLVCYATLHFIVRSERFRAWAESQLSERTGYEVRIEGLRLTPWLGLVASGLAVSRDGNVLFQGRKIEGFVLPHDFFRGRIHRLSLEMPVLRLSLQDLFESSEKSSPNVSIGTLNVHDGEIVLETGRGGPLSLRSISLSAKNVDLSGETGLQMRTYVPALNGSVAVSLSGDPGERRVDVLVQETDREPQAKLSPQGAGGKTVFTAAFRIRSKEGDLYEVKGSGNADEWRWGAETIEGQFDSLVELDGKKKNLTLSTDLRMRRFPAKILATELSLDSGPIAASLRGDYSTERRTLTLRTVKVTSGLGTVEGEGAVTLGEEPAKLATTLRVRDVPLDSLKTFMPAPLSAVAYTGRIAADLKLSGRYNDPAVTGTAWNDGGKVEGEKFSLSRLSFKIPFRWSRAALEFEAGSAQGRDLVFGRKAETQFKAREVNLISGLVKREDKPLAITGDFQLLEGRFSSPDESKVGERLNAKGRFACQDCGGALNFKAEARIESLELLWNKFFGDFKNHRPVIQVEGGYRRETDEFTLNPLRVSLGSIGELAVKGSVRHLSARPGFSLEIQSSDLGAEAFYDFFVREAFKTTHPPLGQIKLAGRSHVTLRTEGSLESFTAEGKLLLQQGEIHERSDRWHIGPVNLDLPLKFRFPEALKEKTDEPAPVGKLSIQGIKNASMTVPEINTTLVLWNNSLRFPEPIRVLLFGGICVIEKLAWQDVIGSPLDLAFSLRLDNLRLHEVTETLGWHRFGGSLSGSIPEVRWTGDSLKSAGNIALDVFGGRVTIRGMEIEKPLSPVRSIKMDVRLEGVDLEQASETFEFGRISGVLEGAVGGLVITQGQPSEFKADIHTVEKRGVSQWISVEALNKITVLSSGNEAGSVYGGISEFFDFFRYSKLGFKATLKNDKMILRGIETKNDQEYLVVGTLLPPTVNIISHTQQIGFSELLRRLERVQQNKGAKSSQNP